jgi:hypothetical protein
VNDYMQWQENTARLSIVANIGNPQDRRNPCKSRVTTVDLLVTRSPCLGSMTRLIKSPEIVTFCSLTQKANHVLKEKAWQDNALSTWK